MLSNGTVGEARPCRVRKREVSLSLCSARSGRATTEALASGAPRIGRKPAIDAEHQGRGRTSARSRGRR
jgi:hypothetical protein